MMSKYKCVIFDCDGVLVDSETISNAVFVDMANELGANIDLKYALKYFKGSFFQECVDHVSKLIDSEIPQSFEKEYRQRSFDAFKANIKPIEGVLEVLQNIELPFCVASSGPENKIKLNLELTGLLPYFGDNIFSAYAIQKWKPDPGVFLLAAETMGYKPNACVVIEDSLSGIKAAVNGGFDVFGFTAHDINNELEALATKTFDNMSDLLEMI